MAGVGRRANQELVIGSVVVFRKTVRAHVPCNAARREISFALHKSFSLRPIRLWFVCE